MSNFVERLKPESKVSFSQVFIPTVQISQTALGKMHNYVQQCPDEIGWLGTATYDEETNVYTIHDTFLFTQKVHATTTEIKPEGLSEFATEILTQEDGMETWNNMRMWGHSHVNMGLTPSAQDNTQMQEFSQIGQDWFIRLIANKKGEMKLDLFHYRMGITILDVPWERMYTEEEALLEQQVHAEIKRLQTLLAQKNNEVSEALKEDVKTEISEKVSKLTYGRAGTNYDMVTAYGRYVNMVWKSWTMEAPTKEEVAKHHKLIPNYVLDEYCIKHGLPAMVDLKKNNTLNDKSEREIEDEEDAITGKIDVYTFFNERELIELTYCHNIFALEQCMDDYGYKGQFSQSDLKIIWDVAQDTLDEQEVQNELDRWRFY